MPEVFPTLRQTDAQGKILDIKNLSGPAGRAPSGTSPGQLERGAATDRFEQSTWGRHGNRGEPDML